MNRTLVTTAVVAALAGSVLTYKLADTADGPNYVYAQDQKFVSLTFAPLVRKTLPAVVTVETEATVRPTNRSRRAPQGLPPGLEDFFGFGFPDQQPPRRGGGTGSGVIVTNDGYILTNNHVVENADKVKVTLSDRREFTAKVIGTDPRTDVAVLKIDGGNNLAVLPISDSTKVQVGDVALAMGNPFGLGQTVTMGIISATGRAGLNPENYEDFLQTDAAINPGNSGGALVNTNGELIGINTAIISRSGGNQGVGFAIPINMAREVMDQLVKTGKVVRGYMGAGVQDITPELAKAFKLSSPRGAAITSVEEDSPAERGGLRAGDVVTAVNGQPVDDAGALRLRISRTAPGTPVELTVSRPEGQTKLTVTLGTLPGDRGGAAAPGGEGPDRGTPSALEGVSVQAVTPDIAAELNLPADTRGVVVTRVNPQSAAALAGLRQGDVITQVNRKPVNSARELEQAVSGGGTALLLVRRGPGSIFIPVEPANNR